MEIDQRARKFRRSEVFHSIEAELFTSDFRSKKETRRGLRRGGERGAYSVPRCRESIDVCYRRKTIRNHWPDRRGPATVMAIVTHVARASGRRGSTEFMVAAGVPSQSGTRKRGN